jgi:hypothetical protein
VERSRNVPFKGAGGCFTSGIFGYRDALLAPASLLSFLHTTLTIYKHQPVVVHSCLPVSFVTAHRYCLQHPCCQRTKMGMSYRRYLTGERIYGCSKCKTHLATIHSMMSRVSSESVSINITSDRITIQAFNGQHGRAYLFDIV